MKRFESYYYTSEDQKGDPIFNEFSTEKAMINHYKKHKNDTGKYNWFLSKRNINWEIVKDYELEEL